MRVLVACEYSGVVRDAFRARGHHAVSCDVLPSERPGPHFQCDVREVLYGKWDMLIAFPPCQYLARSGLHWLDKQPGRREKMEDALDFVRELLSAPVEKIALENPIGRIGSAIRKPDQVIQPWQFGHYESKATCLWLKNLPPLQPTNIVKIEDWDTWDNTYHNGQHTRTDKRNRAHETARTYAGVAAAMAQQWGGA